jgi:hypothetical protein
MPGNAVGVDIQFASGFSPRDRGDDGNYAAGTQRGQQFGIDFSDFADEPQVNLAAVRAFQSQGFG